MVLDNPMHETRKRDHIELAMKSQTSKGLKDNRFYYEPLLKSHPTELMDLTVPFLGKKLKYPFWVSSMTGGVGEARIINQNLAKLCHEFQIGMGLGSCRVLLDSNEYFDDFNLRPILGNDVPFFANLGVAQCENLFLNHNEQKILDLIYKLQVDGLIIHVNPLQEWFQPEGDRYKLPAITTIEKCIKLLKNSNKKIIVKEVGQGMGPASLKKLLSLDLDALELAGFGGTNFAKLEILRSKNSFLPEELFTVGHSPQEMISFINELANHDSTILIKELIISGGVENFLDAYALQSFSRNHTVIGFASNFLKYSENYQELKAYMISQIEGLKMAKTFLTPISSEEK
jgi:isopentenyl-diphosphate delta-isomerase